MIDDIDNFMKKFLDEQEAARIRNEIYRQEIVDGLLKIPMEGFNCDSERIVISEDLEIVKIAESDRDAFFKRAASLELSDYKSENNWHFIHYKYKSQRQGIGGSESGNRILMMAIFFGIACDSLFKINKAQSFGRVREDLTSLGISKIPNAPMFFDHNSTLSADQVNSLIKFWPLFKQTFDNRSHFGLVARRFYYSLIRLQWEDQLVDSIIALEGLLLPETSEQNKGGKLARRVSLLTSEYYARDQVATLIRECYDLRNAVVHGDLITEGNFNDTTALVADLQKIAKAAIREYLLSYRGLTPYQMALVLDGLSRFYKR